MRGNKNARYKIKKYNKGIQNIAGGLVKGAGIAGLAGDALISNSVKDKYGKTDTSQAALGSGLKYASMGAQLGSVIPGIGTVVGAGLGLVGGAAAGIIGANKANKLVEGKRHTEANEKFNDTIQTDTPIQKKQFKKGGTAKQQVIEIEGKQAPEIHTDKSMTQVKSLGTTPHSKGGDKVLAQEGDVVFPTQNNPEKYNKIMKAIREKDLPTLKKEKSKLPKDTAPRKYSGGTESIGKRDGIQRDANGKIISRKNVFSEPGVLKDNKITNRTNNTVISKPLADPSKEMLAIGQSLVNGQPAKKVAAPSQGMLDIGKSLAAGGSGAPIKEKILPTVNITAKRESGERKGGKKSTAKSNFKINPNEFLPKSGLGLDTDITGIETKETQAGIDKDTWDSRMAKVGKNYIGDEIAEQANKHEAVKQITNQKSTGDPLKDHLNSALELAPALYNLGQGLFGKTETVDRQYLNPDKIKYNDLSAELRSQSNAAERTAQSNARNLSGGNVGNARANSQAASNENLGRLGQINAQEAVRHDTINTANVEIGNQAKGANLQLKNQYDELDAQNRAIKSDALSRGLDGLGQIGTRNILQKNELEAYKIGLETYAQGGPYAFQFNDKNEVQSKVMFEKPMVKTQPTNVQPTTDKNGKVLDNPKVEKQKFNPFRRKKNAE
jgi:hypothetical protein